jgi:SCP-2 sterol transfer family protein
MANRVRAVARTRDPTADFFVRVCHARHEMLSPQVSATVRFDLERGGETDHWLMDLHDGLILVSREDRPADCVISAEKKQFDRLATGEQHLVAAILRHQVRIEGDAALMPVVRKLFPGPPGAHDSRVTGE